ncbi:MAG: ATP synthase F1 subunit gamma [Bacteroidales bacterium]|nr:ATP synthase F1 subunit gamma [Bacteroidales bacterium]
MPSLKEIKGRIASVNSTLKITSAMKMVASAKLRKAQNAIGNMVPYQKRLSGILCNLMGSADAEGVFTTPKTEIRKVALVCFSSNSSLCGGFNANVIREAGKVIDEYRKEGVEVTVYSIGRKMAEAMKKKGYPSPEDYSDLSSEPNYSGAAAVGQMLSDAFVDGTYDKVELIYNHFKSTASQPTVRETYLPLTVESQAESAADIDYIVEPDRQTQIDLLLPKVVLLKIYTVLLDSAAAEHAARTVAMQIATDNGNDLLQELTLEYNKGRQQKITSEILDLEGGALE